MKKGKKGPRTHLLIRLKYTVIMFNFSSFSIDLACPLSKPIHKVYEFHFVKNVFAFHSIQKNLQMF